MMSEEQESQPGQLFQASTSSHVILFRNDIPLELELFRGPRDDMPWSWSILGDLLATFFLLAVCLRGPCESLLVLYGTEPTP